VTGDPNGGLPHTSTFSAGISGLPGTTQDGQSIGMAPRRRFDDNGYPTRVGAVPDVAGISADVRRSLFSTAPVRRRIRQLGDY
jgi:hypothetical protein